jgi:hypothetical protein
MNPRDDALLEPSASKIPGRRYGSSRSGSQLRTVMANSSTAHTGPGGGALPSG